ncbi:YncE family protein [Sphingomonas sp. CROZ-RG-20F-R02-07]|uniref:YncE family protein n=1 Tax=Sphingomonas sp. CROZ-RG-20F-R02-07 TaxID=2914832 RepID=UPI001F57929F|nr:YncE family protein [Sphingomonas sp. CROZ-RG-20F-R02-07]
MRPALLALLAAATPVFAAPAPNPAPAPTYAVTGSIAGPDGGWDYARVDSKAHRLYVARPDSVTMVDLAKGDATSWGTLARGHAVVPLPDHRLLVTSGNDATVRFFDTASGRQIASLPVGKKPDAAIDDEPHARAYVMNGVGGTVSVIDTNAMRVTRTIAVKPALEYAALADGTLFINNEDLNEIEVVDVAQGKTGAPIAMPGCEGPTGLAYDARRAMLVSACSNGQAAIVDANARRLVTLIPIGKGADAVILDAARRLAFVPCGKDGVLDILALDRPGGIAHAGRVTTEVGARTGALDPATGIVYLPTARFAPSQAAGARPAPLPGSFHILVVTPKG